MWHINVFLLEFVFLEMYVRVRSLPETNLSKRGNRVFPTGFRKTFPGRILIGSYLDHSLGPGIDLSQPG